MGVVEASILSRLLNGSWGWSYHGRYQYNSRNTDWYDRHCDLVVWTTSDSWTPKPFITLAVLWFQLTEQKLSHPFSLREMWDSKNILLFLVFCDFFFLIDNKNICSDIPVERKLQFSPCLNACLFLTCLHASQKSNKRKTIFSSIQYYRTLSYAVGQRL